MTIVVRIQAGVAGSSGLDRFYPVWDYLSSANYESTCLVLSSPCSTAGCPRRLPRYNNPVIVPCNHGIPVQRDIFFSRGIPRRRNPPCWGSITQWQTRGSGRTGRGLPSENRWDRRQRILWWTSIGWQWQWQKSVELLSYESFVKKWKKKYFWFFFTNEVYSELYWPIY